MKNADHEVKMTTLGVETARSDGDAPTTAPFGVYTAALGELFRTGSDKDRKEVLQLGREIATQQIPLAELIAAIWQSGRPCLLSASDLDRPRILELMTEVQQELCTAYDQAARMERRAHTRLASAYSQKLREVTTLLDSLPAFVFLKDSDLYYTSANRLYCEVLGLPQEQVVAHNDFDLFPDHVAHLFSEQDHQVIASGEAVRSESTVEFNGTDRTVVIIRAPVLDPRGRVSGLIGVGFDITERKRLEKERTLLAAALESAGEAGFITDTRGTIQYANKAFGRMTGYAPEEAIGKNTRLLKSGRESQEFFRQMWATLLRGEVWQGTLQSKKKDSTIFDIDQTVAPVRGGDGETISYVAVTRDITEQKQLVEKLQRAVMVKTEFTSMVSHELRTPLTAIREAVNVVEDQTAGPINKDQAGFLALAKRNLDRLHRLINDTLDFAKLERGEFRLELGMHNLNELTREIVMQQRLAADKQGLALELSLDDQLPAVRLDPDRISQVLINLIGNAIRYCEQGSIQVSTQRRQNEAVVKVQDTGPGIPSERLEHIFEPFVQLSTGPGRRVGGTGLGLSICKQIIKLHGGHIGVESEPGHGATFFFALRLSNEEES